MSLAPGTRVGAYEVMGSLGAGGMGEVYRARDLALGRDVAIKVLPAPVSADPDRLARFAREARVLASLNHPNIASIYGFEENGPVRALLLELVEGETLAARIARGAFPLKESLRIARDIAGAVDAAHEKGIVHRDLKPANVMLTPDGMVKVLDFGIAKAAGDNAGHDAAPTVTATGAGIPLGTPAYMSPEQMRGQTVDKRADLWAQGCVLFEMLTGRRAFAGAATSDTIAAVLEREPQWQALPEATPEHVRHLLHRCLEKNVADRWRDAGDLRLELDNALRTIGHERRQPVTIRRALAWREGAAWMIAALAVAAAVVMMGSPRESPASAPAIRFDVPPPPGTTFSFEAGAPWPEISPDGRTLAFVAISSNGEQQLWVKPIDQSESRPVRGTSGAYRPIWSPDSGSLAYFNDGRLWRVDLPDGTPRVLASTPYSGGLKGTWGRGAIVVPMGPGFHRIPPSGGPATLLNLGTQPFVGGVLEPQQLTFLPDDRILYLVNDLRQQKRFHCIASLTTTPMCEIALTTPARYSASGHLVFIRDGLLRAQPFDLDRLELTGQPVPIADTRINLRETWNAISFSVSANGVLAYHPSTGESRHVWLDRSGKPLGVLGPLESYGPARLSRDGTRAVFGRSNAVGDQRDLWLHEIAGDRASRFTFDAQANNGVFSPDGQRVAFSVRGQNESRLYAKDVAGSGTPALLNTLQPTAGVNDWSSDGRYVLYQVTQANNGWDLWVAPTSPAERPFALVSTGHGERQGSFSPDGRFFAYDSTESGRREIWVQPFPPTGARWQVSTTGGFSPRWRKDSEMFYVAADGRMMAIPVTRDKTLAFGTPVPLFQTPLREGAYGAFDVTADGRFLVNMPPDGRDAKPITVIVNWTSALRQ